MIKYSLAALALVATPALAQEGRPFGGFYAGANVGYDHVILSGFGTSGAKDGVVFSAVGGYDANLGSAIVGVEAELGGSSAKDREANIYTAGDSGEVKAARDIYFGARAGLLATPETLVYVKGGYVNGRININYTSPTPGNSFSAGSSVDGFRVGAGVEQAFGPFKARFEYRYSDYGQFSYAGTPLGIDMKRHQVVAGLFANF
jgi:outer membrane immunogenic protein